MLRSMFLAVMLLLPGAAFAASQPEGAPTLFIPGYNETISYWGEVTPVGDCFRVYSLTQATNTWMATNLSYCSYNLPAEVAGVGGNHNFVMSIVVPQLNQQLLQTFPSGNASAGTPSTGDATLDAVQADLFATTKPVMFNGAPTLVPK